MAFVRYFPGQEVLLRSHEKQQLQEEDYDVIKSETRYFTRLTALATWRSEYLLRTRLLRSLTRGKPGASTGSVGSTPKSTSGRKAGAVLTYNSKLPWTISHLHAVFANGNKAPKVISGTTDLGVGSVSDPSTGKVDRWGLDDPFAFAQLDEVFPSLELYGLGDGPAAIHNVMDVSQPYGVLGGEGFPGGRVFYRAANDIRGRYLGEDSAIIDMAPEIPKIPELSEGVCSLWIAKSPAVPSMTQSIVGMMAGSSLGVVTAYALGYESSGVSRYSNGEMTARWVLSPGVPIVALKVDDNYNQRRKALKRVWAVALNALGEVFYLRDVPMAPVKRKKSYDDMTRTAWMVGRTAYWELVESTRRVARVDEFDKNAVRGTYSPRSPSFAMNLSKAQVVAEAREIEKFLRHSPSHFRKACEGWDMRRKLEVDFAGGDDSGSAEGVFVITCGFEHGEPAAVTRYARHVVANEAVEEAYTEVGDNQDDAKPTSEATTPKGFSLFGGVEEQADAGSSSAYPTPASQPPTPAVADDSDKTGQEEWSKSVFELKLKPNVEITVSAVDSSTYAVLAPFEDPLITGPATSTPSGSDTPITIRPSQGELPGRRARMLAIGTDTGAVYAWNMRAVESREHVKPLRTIQTESPEISSLALSALCIIHGGSDSLVQAWDPLSSTIEPVRTLNAKSSGRLPRHIVNANPMLRQADYAAVRAIYLDPDSTILRGVLSFGTFIRFWTYNSTTQSLGRKRRSHHSGVHGRLASRRLGGNVSGYIAAEEAELHREQEHRAREEARLQRRFGVGLADLTEEEALKYAEMISQESFILDEQRRFSTSDTGSAADVGDTASSAGSSSTNDTPEPTNSGGLSPSASTLPVLAEEPDDDYEEQIQRAIRLSLMEGVNDAGQSPRGNSSDYGFNVTVKEKKKKGKQVWASPSSSNVNTIVHTPTTQFCDPSPGPTAANPRADVDADLEMALKLSLAEEESRQEALAAAAAAGLGRVEVDEFPALEVKGKGKGRASDY